MKWIRTCQSCGLEQACPRPTFNNTKDQDGLTNAYRNRRCKKCKSEDLDYGSDCPSTQDEIENHRKYLESLENE